MALTDSIGNTLIQFVHSMPKDWPGIFSAQPGIEEELRQTALIEPTNSADFLRFLLSSRQQFLEQLFIATCLLYTSPSPRDGLLSRMPSSA